MLSLHDSLGLSDRRVWKLWTRLDIHTDPHLGSNGLGHRPAHSGHHVYKKGTFDSNEDQYICPRMPP